MVRIFSAALFFLFLAACSAKEEPLFQPISSEKSGITFSNIIIENEMLNMINYQYLYNGGGVGVGDFNNDSLPDIYFTSSLSQNKLYLNRGDFRFEDVTDIAGVGGEKKWCRGVSVVDINNDGLLDLYVCAAAWQKPELKKDILYVNQGVTESTGIPQFKEMAAEYGLVDTVSTHMAAFFDYDNDQDLDLYLVVNDLNQEFPSTFRKIRNDGTAFTNDVLYRCDWDESKQHPVYTNVTKEAGITWEGNGLGVSILDINRDGWKDIYVSNDYLSGNLLYINNRNGTFTNRNNEYFKHGSLNAMGNDAADINNDGLVDIVEMDMMPEDQYRQKMMMNPVDYNWYLYSEQYGFPYQTVRNTLQVNQGPRLLEGDSVGAPVFSEIAYYSGVPFTDWSWAALLMDMDNDGFNDLMTTNGLPKDVTDLDFIAYRDQSAAVTLNEALQQLPAVQISNYIFRNNGDLTFSNKTNEWGWNFPTYSAGIAYADFDRDGDMDVVINNTNQEATLLENKSRQNRQKNNYLNLRFRGNTSNMNGLGTIATVFHSKGIQTAELSPYRGYMSSVENMLHFGLDTISRIDSLVIQWPDGKVETINGVTVNQTFLVIQSANAKQKAAPEPETVIHNWFTNITQRSGLLFLHQEADFVDFNLQRQLPHKFSQSGPALASADLNGDGLTDILIGGSAPYPSLVFFQDANQKFSPRLLVEGMKQPADDVSICVFDADGDRDPDVYLARGGMELPKGDKGYADQLLINDGKGNFRIDSSAIPPNLASKSVVRYADFDSDGDPDLFVGGAVIPGQYPAPESGYLLRNDSKNGMVRFTNVTSEAAPELTEAGLISDAVWADYDNDKDPDLVLTGKWMGILFFNNEKGKLKLQHNALEKETGWWNTLTAVDIDKDGDLDFAAGNFGTNGYFNGNPKEPVTAYYADFDGNNRSELLLSSWRPGVLHGQRKEYPVASRDQLAEEIPSVKKQFASYAPYAQTDMPALLKTFTNKYQILKEAVNFHSIWIENKGKSGFEIHVLPAPAQWSPVNSIVAGDYNGDGHTDLLLAGNEYGMHPMPGRYDASNGVVLKGDGKGHFTPLQLLESGIFIPGNAKSMTRFTLGNRTAVAVAQNRGNLLLFQQKK
jgi:hypothetical protein